ncbi:MAG: hypothetical protein CMN28_00270 [Salinisphaeraceae bacterium]|nr:hypothetical protein [Salinisphaeraceae bacterium]
MGRLNGKVALVTGSGRGIGRAIALEMAREGADIMLSSRTQGELDSVAQEISDLGRRAETVICDALDAESIKAMIKNTAEAFGRIDILMNNVGGLTGDLKEQLTLTYDDARFEEGIFLNLTSAYYATRYALPYMVEQDYGRIIFNGSGYAKRGGGLLAYTAAKHGLIGMMRAMIYQVPTSITVNTLCPGWTNTQLADWDALAELYETDGPTVKAMMEQENAQKRILEPEELGPMAALLAAPESAGITGQVISVDGGYKI